MKVPTEVRCVQCSQIFCCVGCRQVHEERAHGIQFDCPVCRRRALPFGEHAETESKLFEHVCKEHLPLRCRRCHRRFDNAEQLDKPGLCKTEEKPIMAVDHMMPMNRGRKLKRLAIDDKSAVMTSTPTHPVTRHWDLFQKSFTSTLSGINSPDSDVVQSPPLDDQKSFPGSSGEQLSPMETPSQLEPEAQHPKGIISRSRFSSADCSRDLSNKRKRVTFAEDQLEPVTVACGPRRFKFEFMKPKRPSTPGKARGISRRTPRFQAIINNFESRASKMFSTPEQVFKRPNLSDETPQTVDPAIAARTIDFKHHDSPTLLEDVEVSPVTSTVMKIAERSSSHSNSVLETDVSNAEHYKSCIPIDEELPAMIKVESQNIKDLPQKIAQSIQETLNAALSCHEGSTEIQLNIIITKKIISIKESHMTLGSESLLRSQREKPEIKNESTTIWSRIVNNLKWVWKNRNLTSSVNRDLSKRADAILLSANKRKQFLAQLEKSPRSKRLKYAGRISGRRPLDRMLRGGAVAPERSHSSDMSQMMASQLLPKTEKSQNLNKSF